MKKNLLLIAALMAATLLASCASSDDGLQTDDKSPTELTPADGRTPVNFSAYAERGVTRGGKEGLLDLDALKALKANGGGFGVFGYYTDLKKYDQTYVPNLMYNQGVFWRGEDGLATEEAWLYSPVVYWPNESGTDAQSDDEDKVTFFAYAPYVESTSGASGSVADATSGITGFSRNSNAGDPLVKYIASFSTSSTVDLCWGVCSDASWAKIQGGTSQSMTTGLPWIDVEHPQTTSQRMNFTFKHALAQLNVTIDADADVTAHATDDVMHANTKIYVRSISFTGIALKGALNLNNTTPNQALWLDYSGTTDLPYGQSVTVKDGRRDGREGTTGAEATNETPAGLNPAVIQNDASHPTTGVTTVNQNLFEPAVAAAIPGQPTNDEIAAALGNPVYVIPTGEAITVTIVYDVETTSPNLPGYLSDGITHGSSIENKITKTIYYNGSGMSLESGKKYVIALHLGMNSVKVDAEVGDWDYTMGSQQSWLPSNQSEVRILKSGNQITHATLSTSDADLALTGSVSTPGVGNTFTWTSSDPTVASIADASVGTIHPEADGECTITATSTVTGKSATIKLLVTHKYSDVVAGDVGKIIAANGYIYPNTTKAAEYGTNGVGIISYVGAAGSVDQDASASSYKALALALTDVNDGATCQWADNNSTDCSLTNLTDVNNLYVTESSYQSGIGNTSTLIGDPHTHAAATAAKDYGVNVSGFTNSGWFLPSISQWNLMIKTVAPTSESDVTSPGETPDPARLHNGSDIPMWSWINAGYTAAVINPILTANGGSGLKSAPYWSSTESSASAAWAVSFDYGTVGYYHSKTYNRYVRAAFAF